MQFIRGWLKVAVFTLSTIVLTTSITGCDETDASLVQQEKWSGEGWRVFGQLPGEQDALSSTFFAERASLPGTRFVDSVAGLNANPGTQSQPWATLAHALTKIKVAGAQIDTLLIKCGSAFNEQLMLGEQSLRDTGIDKLRIGVYGSCTEATRPVIYGSDPVSSSGWSPVAGTQVFVKSGAGASDIQRVFLGHEPLRRARTPNYVSEQQEYALATENAGNPQKSFYVSSAHRTEIGSNPLVGAVVYVRTTPWRLARAEVDAFDSSSGLVTLKTALGDAIKTGAGYYFEGMAWMLDAQGEWAASGGDLKVRLPQDLNPNSVSNLRASVRNNGVWLYKPGKPVDVEGLSAQQQAQVGFNVTSDDPITLTSVSSMFSGDYGIALQGPWSRVSQSRVIGSGNTGILGRGRDIRVLDNVVADVARYFDGSAESAGRTPVGIRVEGIANNAFLDGSHTWIIGNIVHRTASTGITFPNKPGVWVKLNSVVTACMRFSDCGGIYSFQHRKWDEPAGAVATDAQANVTDNIVVGVAPTNLHGYAFGSKNQNVGIYLDELSSRVTVQNNDVVSAEVGIYLHKARSNVIRGNRVSGVTHASFKAAMSNHDAPSPINLVTNNVLEDNVFFSRRVQSIPAYAGGGAPIPVVASLDSEPVYAQLWELHGINAASSVFFGAEGGNVSRRNKVRTLTSPETNRWTLSDGVIARDSSAVWGLLGYGTPRAKVDLADWVAVSGAQDDHEDSQSRYAPYKLSSTGVVELIPNGSFGAQLQDWAISGGLANALTGTECGGGSCAKVTGTAQYDRLVSKLFNVTAGQLYLMKYGVGAGSVAAKHRAFIENQTTFSKLGVNVPSTPLAASQFKNIEIFFRAKLTDSGAFDFRAHDGQFPSPGVPQAPAYLKEVSLKAVPAVDFLPSTPSLAMQVVNAGSQPISLTCDQVALQGRCDVQTESAQPVQWPLTVPARAAVVLYQRDPWAQ